MSTDPNIEKRKLEIEEERLNIEKQKAELERKFLNRHLGTLITSIISFAAIGVSLIQLWVATIDKQREQESKTEERRIASEQESRDWALKVATFLSENQPFIFSDKEAERTSMREIITSTFPPDIASTLFERLDRAARTNSPSAPNQPANTTWQEANTQIDQRREQLVKDMFNDNKDIRIAATTKLIREWNSDPKVITGAVEFAQDNLNDKNGVINTIVLLQNFDPRLLEANREQILTFLESAKKNGGQTAALAEQVRSQLNK